MTNTCWLHVPVHSSEECKALKRYFKKCAAQRLHKENEARSGGETKCGKSVELDRKLKEVNIMEHDDPIPKKKKGGGWLKITRVKVQKQTQKKLDVLMVLTASRLVKLNIIRITPNDSL